MANENNKSDYTKPFMDLLKYLPEPYQSDVNSSLFSNLFNRFLTKQEIEKVAGYIGRGNANAIISRQIKESNVHRQAFQLQPILNDKIGTIEHMASWKDIQNELTRLGVDIEDFAAWGAVQKFNWVPPIDLNKLINYRDYYWVDSDNKDPQYITIRSRCATAVSRVIFWDSLISQYGSTFPIIDILPIDDRSGLSTYSISAIDKDADLIEINGDATADLSVAFPNGDFFDIIGTASNDGTYKISVAPTYDGSTNITSVVVTDDITVDETNIGNISLRRFDKIVFGANDVILDGDYTSLFETGFIIRLRGLTNTELNNKFVTVVSSESDINNTSTIVTIETISTDNTFALATGSPAAGSEGSLEEQQTIFVNDRNCQCGNLGGWDDGILWDDNPSDPLWGDSNGNNLPDHDEFVASITNSGPPLSPGTENELWFDDISNILYQYTASLDNGGNVIGWKIIWNDFNLILDSTNGFALWDLVEACDTRPHIHATDQWSEQNKWLYKNDITNFANVKRATQPIIEYDWDIELNEWTYTSYKWSYRSETDNVFTKTDNTPPLIELEPITWWELENSIDPNNKTIILDYRYGDLTNTFVPGKQINIGGTTVELHDVDYSEYKSLPSNQYAYRTYVTFKALPTSDGDLNNLKPNTNVIYPFLTENGDAWSGYGAHWLFNEAIDAVPVPHQVDNKYIEIAQGSVVTPVVDPNTSEIIYTYTTSLYAQNYIITAVAGVQTFNLVTADKSDYIPSPFDTKPLRRKALFGFDDIRVYLSDLLGENVLRQFGNYHEIGEAVLNVIGVDFVNNEFVVGISDTTPYFLGGDTIQLYGNSGSGTQTFSVSATPPTTNNRIKISTAIPPSTTVDGEITNVFRPVSTEGPTGAHIDIFTNTKDVTVYVMAVHFFNAIPAGVSATIEVGEAAINEIGFANYKVRVDEDEVQFKINGNKSISKIEYRRVEQVKTKINQYPLFDIFTINGDPAFKANPIFGYRTSPEYDIKIGLRIVFDPVSNVYEFDQFLLEEDNGELFTYRDYANKDIDIDFWYNPETKKLKFWGGTEWNERTEMSNHFRKAVVSDVEPSNRETQINELYWYDTTLNVLKQRLVDTIIPSNSKWNIISPIYTLVTDINLQSIWKSGLNNELYIPEKVDWQRRSLIEYNIEKDDFITARIAELFTQDSSLDPNNPLDVIKVTATATAEWFVKESNHLSPNGVWIGDWEIPDPLYFNNQHENRKFLTSRELLTHFTTIIDNQPKIPGYTGSTDGMFDLIPSVDVNYGVGGTIKEFNDGFDTMLSSTFVNNVTPRSLIEFAHDQYESLLNSIKEIYRRQATPLLVDVDVDNILNLSSYIADEIIKQYELNDQAQFVYGDTTTFTDVDGINDLGVRNWIATLPYVNLIEKHVPVHIIDTSINKNEIVHHDSHRNQYSLSEATADIIAQLVVAYPDSRTTDGTMGRISTSLPPNNIIDFDIAFSTASNKEGVYWYNTTTKTLYRYVVALSGNLPGTDVPSSSYADGTLWMDLDSGNEFLRIKDTDFLGAVTWNAVTTSGRLHNGTNPADLNTATISAWQEIDLDNLLNDTIFELETRLYNNVPDFSELAYDFTQTQNNNSIKYAEYLEEAFLDYVSQSDISTPFRNSEFSSSNAFTWNYKYSAPGGGLKIITINENTNSFVVSGNHVSVFDPCFASGTGSPAYTNCPSTVVFYIKNSGTNDGTWSTLTSDNIGSPFNPVAKYDSLNNTTEIFVSGDVLTDTQGLIYSGILPSSSNDGSESGGDWRDLYTKVYGTPYPHLEPWVLQGYTNKPDWWDTEYLNNDVDQWGERTWKYKHGFEIVSADNNSIDGVGSPPANFGTFNIAGNFNTNFVSGSTFNVDSAGASPSNNGQWTVDNRDTIITVNDGIAGTASIVIDDTDHLASVIYLPNMIFSIINSTNNIIETYTIKTGVHLNLKFTITVKEEIASGLITTGTDFINGSLYDPINNETKIKVTTLVDSASTGRISKTFGMWENIRTGTIPAGESYPNGVISITGNPTTDRNLANVTDPNSIPNLPSFSYFSVNIGNDVLDTQYNPDGILPPYWDYTSVFGTIPETIDRTIRSIFFSFSTEIVSPNEDYVFGDSGTVEWQWKTSSQFLYDQLTVAYRLDPVRYVSSTFGFDITKVDGLQIDRDTRNTPSHTRINFHGDVVNDKQFKSDGLNQWYVNFNRYSGYDANFSDFRELWTGWKAPLTYQFASFIDTPSLSVGHRFVDITNFDYNITSKRAPGVDDYWLDAFNIEILNIPYDIVRYDNQLDWRFETKTNANISRNVKYYDVHNYQFYVDVSTNECLLYTWKIENIDTFNKTFTLIGDQGYVFSAGSTFNIVNSTGNNNTYNVVLSEYNKISNTTLIYVSNVISSAINDGLLRANYRTHPWVTGDGVYLSTAETLPIPLVGDTINGLTKYFIIEVGTDTTRFKLANTPQDSTNGIAIDITSAGTRDQFVGKVLSTFLADGSSTNWRYYEIDKTNVLVYNTPHEIQGMQTLVNIINGYDVYSDELGWKVNSDKLQLDPDTSKIINWQIEIQRFITYAYLRRTVNHQVNDRYPVTVNASTNIWAFTGTNKTFITGDVATVISSNSVYPAPISSGTRYYVIRDSINTFKLAASNQDALDGNVINITSTVGIGNLQITVPKNFATLIPKFEINPFRNSIWIRPSRGIVSNIITGPVEDIRSSQLIFNQNGEQIKEDQLRVYRQDKETKIHVVDAVDSKTALTLISPDYTLLHLGGLHLFIDAYEHAMVLNNYNSEGNLLYDPFIGLNVTKYEMLFNRQPDFTQRPNVGGYYLETFFNQGANLKENIEAGVENLRNAYDTYNTLETNLMTQYSRKALGYEGATDYLTNLNLSQKSQFVFWRGMIQNKGSINAVNAFINSRRFIDAKVDDFWAIKLGEFGSVKEKEFPEMYTTTIDARSNELRLEFIDNDADETLVEDTFVPIKMSDQDRWYNQPDQVKVLRDNGKVMYFDLKVKNKIPVQVTTTAASTIFGNAILTNNNGVQYINHTLDTDFIEITQTLDDGSVVVLVDGINYRTINNNIVEFIKGYGTGGSPIGSPAGSPVGSPIVVVAASHILNIVIWGFVVNDDAQNPARIIDRESETQISPIQYWDPARGIHYSNAIHNVDLQNDIDPAKYNKTPQVVDTDIWKDDFVGTTWFNTENLDYTTYYSDKMFPDTTERFRNWGQLADWSEIEILEWVESDVPPEEWDALAATEEGDRTIIEHLRKSGIARKTLFEKDSITSAWVPLVNKFEEQYASVDATAVSSPPTGYVFTVPLTKFKATGSPLQYLVNVYINGKLFKTDEIITPIGSPAITGTYTINIPDIKEADLVRFVQLAPTDQTVIDEEIAAGNMLQDYEYTQVEFYDELNNIFNKYYFWVGNKRTKPLGRNRTMPILEAEIQLESIPAPHMFFQKPLAAYNLQQEDINVNRIENFTGDSLTTAYIVELTITENTTVLVEIDGANVPDNEVFFVTGGTTIVLDNAPALNTEVKITYTGVQQQFITIPNRFTQAVIRGLQGVVNADRRYTIRFTRNFTLRDNLDVENETIGSIELKNLHEEWKLFRKEQQFNIDRWQWDRITESIVGYKLNDPSVRVPAYDRELYDEKFNTETQYGLEEGQTFANGVLALNSVLKYLLDPDVDFTPIDINIFFTNNNFDTPEDIINSMNAIYNTFTFTNINRIYFSVLHDAFTTKSKYPGLFKTSMISLHGIRPLQTSGIFDD